jgi:uncharacterized SAM-binding protein YcdF (DUF218 family)
MTTQNLPARRYIVAGVLVCAIIFGVIGFRAAGRWLIREDALAHADVILVLSGSMPYRAEEAANVYREGYAAQIWLTHPVSPAEELGSMGIHFESDEEYDKAVLVHDGVPEAAIRVLPDEIVNTEQEIEEARRELGHAGKTSIIVVTSVQHTRRVRALWRTLGDPNMKLIVHGAPQDEFDADHWWRNSRDVLYVTREYLGLINAWLGLPVRPHAT